MAERSEFWENVRNLKKSATDKKIAGVCGGLGEHTPVPAWLWRALLLILIFAGGTGIVAYLVLWICMPASEDRQRPGAADTRV